MYTRFGVLSLLACLLSINVVACLPGVGGCDNNPQTPACDKPLARAGDDRTVNESAFVELAGTRSSDPNDDILSSQWRYLREDRGPVVELRNANTIISSFVAPNVNGDTDLKFQLIVDDGQFTDDDTVTITVKDITPPTLGTATRDISVYGPVTLKFSEPVNPTSLEISSRWLDDARFTWLDSNQALTIRPAFRWESGEKTLEFQIEDAAGNQLTTRESIRIRLLFEDGQSASAVIAQSGFNDILANRNSGVSAAPVPAGLSMPVGKTVLTSDDQLAFIPDQGNRRILAFAGLPETSDLPIFALGQPDFKTRSMTELDGISDLIVYQDSLIATVSNNNKIAIFRPLPTEGAPNAAPSSAMTWGMGSDCTPTDLAGPQGVSVTSHGKLVVADSENNRILVWNRIPLSASVLPDMVLGQDSLLECDPDRGAATPAANSLNHPTGVWTDGQKLAVVDSGNNRVMLWHSFPEESGTPADNVIGQDDFVSREAGISPTTSDRVESPRLGIVSNGVQLFVADEGNGRVLIWNTFPIENGRPADHVLGQPTLDLYVDGATGSPDQLAAPSGLALIGDRLLVADKEHHRILVFRSLQPISDR